MLTTNDLLARNYEASQNHKPLPTFAESRSAGQGPPRIALISCCDPRVVPEEYFGLTPRDAIVFRTVAGHPQGCWKDLVALDTFIFEGFGVNGFEEVIIVHHTDCGSLMFTNDMIHQGIQKRNPESNTENIIGTEFGAVSTSIEQNVRDDLEWLKTAPLVRKELAGSARGFVYNIKTGKLHEV
ncbi:conserved hypothetical protein [Talaromyces stipitatus ATCC 10500]|uniref:Carbonic anhydrase n=1 Tax=Talaromyces stipitatus (strain ATCC 10500 / CBS 375.48 / QM 6759 / NRRL 1006) TaxID=441959 RepID=B8MCV2_TALSN|nr:uncharacterized protein TSTA_113040 [Talaromyces stipitatus ATCC 10500]EED17478.1 conserved hypothetical protein [Talaromyces stipitatus ATCC 10500]